MVAVEIIQPRWLSKLHDRGTSRERSDLGTTATSTSTCSDCSQLKEQLGDVTHRLEAQEVQMDTLRGLMENLRSSTQIAPPAPLPSPAMQTSTPVRSPASIPHAVSPSSIPVALPSPIVPSSTNLDLPEEVPDVGSPQVPSIEVSTLQPPTSLDPDGYDTIPAHGVIPGDILDALWVVPMAEDTRSPRLPSMTGDDYRLPSCPPPTISPTMNETTVDGHTIPPPTIIVSPAESPAVNDALSMRSPTVGGEYCPLPCPLPMVMTPDEPSPPSPSSAVDEYHPPSCPPPAVNPTHDGMVVDIQAVPLPVIVVSPVGVSDTSSPAPTVVVAGCVGPADDTTMDTL